MKYRGIKSGLAALVVVTAGILGGCSNDEKIAASEQLQVYKLRYDQYKEEYLTNFNAAQRAFTDACLDGKLTVDKQKAVFALFDNARKAKDNFEKNARLALEKETTDLGWTKESEELWGYLNQNLNGDDGTPPKLQNYLNSHGIKAEAEACWSNKEKQEAADAAADIISAFADALSD